MYYLGLGFVCNISRCVWSTLTIVQLCTRFLAGDQVCVDPVLLRTCSLHVPRWQDEDIHLPEPARHHNSAASVDEDTLTSRCT